MLSLPLSSQTTPKGFANTPDLYNTPDMQPPLREGALVAQPTAHQ